MELTQNHIQALRKAEELMDHRDFCPYLELKKLIQSDKDRFAELFATYYGLNRWGLNPRFKELFFKTLFENVNEPRKNIQSILDQLSAIPRRKNGGTSLEYSFTSKLIAISDESSPIYDRHVVSFFKVKKPISNQPKDDRIKWFIGFLDKVASSYQKWANEPDVLKILKKFKERDTALEKCHVVRLLDFLVWKVGNAKLLKI